MPDDELQPNAPPRPRRKGIYALPNMITLAALFGGFYAIVMAMHGQFVAAATGIFAAMVLDSLDGRVARWRQQESHRHTQAAGRDHVFADYRLRVAAVVRDYGMHDRAQAPLDSRAVHG